MAKPLLDRRKVQIRWKIIPSPHHRRHGRYQKPAHLTISECWHCRDYPRMVVEAKVRRKRQIGADSFTKGAQIVSAFGVTQLVSHYSRRMAWRRRVREGMFNSAKQRNVLKPDGATTISLHIYEDEGSTGRSSGPSVATAGAVQRPILGERTWNKIHHK
ncbi:hypothetical protein J6590_042024 [Homalodisca vitripennis]|nr:hypothetical protein J6590_042024 [Homalodisca vitripennis]